MKSSSILILGFLFISFLASAQNETMIRRDSAGALNYSPPIESFQSISKLDPDKAALYSAVLPGMGQMYNRQYWKLPILYSGVILIGHFINYNNDFYNAFRNAYIAETDGDDSTTNPFPRFSAQSLELNAQKFKRNRDFMIIMGVVYYLINIVDAHVSAHLIEFEINDDLSLQPSYHPKQQYFAQNVGMSLVLKLHK